MKKTWNFFEQISHWVPILHSFYALIASKWSKNLAKLLQIKTIKNGKKHYFTLYCNLILNTVRSTHFLVKINNRPTILMTEFTKFWIFSFRPARIKSTATTSAPRWPRRLLYLWFYFLQPGQQSLSFSSHMISSRTHAQIHSGNQKRFL